VLLISSAIVEPKLKMRGRGCIIDKQKRLESLATPKILLVGGSNVCYNTNSQLIEDSFHMPVVDMSINAKVGMQFYFEMVKPYIKKNDVIIITPEYDAYGKINFLGDESMYQLSIINPYYLKLLNAKQWIRLPVFVGNLLKDNYTILTADKNSKVSNGRLDYNKWGDYEGHKNLPSLSEKFMNNKDDDYNLKYNQTINDDFIKLLIEFSNYCKSKEAKCLIGYPVYAKKLASDEYAFKIHENLKDMNWVDDNPDTFLYEANQLYDSPNHLLFNMRNERTVKLITLLKNQLINNAQ
jgi:hypothetical protein